MGPDLFLTQIRRSTDPMAAETFIDPKKDHEKTLLSTKMK
jgi:hypothetical protein